MKCYLVGGAIRDRLLNLSFSEKDFVVIGETETSMLEKGFISVGKKFPVFLHPKTKEEFLISERKTLSFIASKQILNILNRNK